MLKNAFVTESFIQEICLSFRTESLSTHC